MDENHPLNLMQVFGPSEGALWALQDAVQGVRKNWTTAEQETILSAYEQRTTDWVCQVCGPVTTDSLPGYRESHFATEGHMAKLYEFQAAKREALRAKVRNTWRQSENALWMAVGMVEVKRGEATQEMTMDEYHEQTASERMEQFYDDRKGPLDVIWEEITPKWTVERAFRRYHIPTTEDSVARTSCGLTIPSYTMVPVNDAPVEEVVQNICEECDPDGVVKYAEVDLIKANLRTCGYCLVEFKNIEACKAHEEGCGM